MKDDIKLYGFKTSDFKGILLTRAKRGPNKAKTVKNAVKQYKKALCSAFIFV